MTPFGPSSVPPAEARHTFFVDRSLGGHVVADALKHAGEVVVVHDDVFEPDAADTTWLTEAGKRNWIVLTKDARIRTNELERMALLEARVAAFMLGRGDRGALDMAAAFLKAMPQMKKALRKWGRPLIGVVTIDGAVSLLYVDGERLRRPRLVK
jgi:predicted nuclease of predicted toxin-antitoxin system